MPALNRVMAGRELRRMIQLYLKAETGIINEIGRLRSLGLVDYHAEAALARVQAILGRLEREGWEYVPKMIEHNFYVHHPEARKPSARSETAEKHERGYLNAEALTGEQTDVVNRLVMNLMGQMAEAHATAYASLSSALVGRVEPDIFRRVGLEQTGLAQAMGRGPFRATPDFVEALRREGVTAFVDKAGRHWSLHTYASMVLRTTSRQAEVLSVLTQDPEWDLFKISRHGTTCKRCAPYEGRVYSKSGTSPDFPPLSAAFGKIDPSGPDTLDNSWLNLHPNCLHQILRWSPMGRSEEEIRKIKDFSSFEKNPPAVDPRTEKQIDAYRKKEQARARRLADYRQWERYRETLGDGVPKTFETFLKHKAAGDEKYRLWRLDYRRRNVLLQHPERALPGAATATAADAKFTRYFFHPDSRDGAPKGAAFSSRLGYHADNWPLMRQEILAAAARYPATFKIETPYGRKYEQMVILQGLKNKPANVLIGWIVHANGTTHFTTAHVEEVK